MTLRGALPPEGELYDGREDTLLRVLAPVDGAADATFRRLRGRPWADAAAAVLSNVSDYGYVWIGVALWKARRPGAARRRAVLELAGAGITSYAVNKGVKLLVGRSRPTGAPAGAAGGSSHVAVRTPSSSSFPSGHTLAAFCTAVVLTEGKAQTAGALTLATAVAASRVHLGAHYASDVLGGALMGSAAGLLVRRALHSHLQENELSQAHLPVE